MAWRSEHNTHLVVRRGVELTPAIDAAITELEPAFIAAAHHAEVTSGLRDRAEQLFLIKRLALNHGIEGEFPELQTAGLHHQVPWQGQVVYVWQPAWSRLLNIGVIVNPPLPARALFDYIRNGMNKKGMQIGESPHFSGRAFDIGGGRDGTIENEVTIVSRAVQEGRAPRVLNLTLERKQNCLHVDVRRGP